MWKRIIGDILMTVKQLIDKLQEFPENMPVTTFYDINPNNVDDPDWINIEICTWKPQNYPYYRPSFAYVNLT